MKVLFHYPLPLNPNATSASGIRPRRMVHAFSALGFSVDIISGHAKERKAAIKKIKKNISNGVRYDFLYAESSTMPTILTERHHLPTRPLMDWNFFRFCKKNKIPIGLFYRDIYWLFEEYGRELNTAEALVAKLAYRFDLEWYQRTLTKLYLPSIEMGKYIPRVSPDKFASLPPGHSATSVPTSSLNSPLKLFYVGGLSDHYQMHKLFYALKRFPSIQCTICTREAEWLMMRHEYPALTNNIRVIHATGNDMEKALREADITVLFVKPQEYWEFAVPFKLFEYLGFIKPILASSGTLAGKFVAEHNIGWTIDYDEVALSTFLEKLLKNPDEILKKHEVIESVAPEHSWRARAEQVVRDLTQ